MRAIGILSTLGLTVGTLMAGSASAQSYGNDRYGYGNNATVRCESHDGRRNYCATPRNARVEMARQLSRSACIPGRTWGSDRNGVWVDQGCRADFVIAGNGYRNDRDWRNGWEYGNRNDGYGQDRTIRCESEGGRMRVCRVDTLGNVQLARQLSSSRCIEGQTWGVNRQGIWVDGGCRADFTVNPGRRGYGNRPGYSRGNQGGYGYGNQPGYGYGSGTVLRCESQGDRYTDCRLPNGVNRVRLVRTLSNSPCVEGSSWGLRNGQIWVNNGCRAEFALE